MTPLGRLGSGFTRRSRSNGARRRSSFTAAVAVTALALVTTASAVASSGPWYPAKGTQRSAIMKSLTANDGSSAQVRGVYVSSSNSSLAVVCIRTPEAGIQAFVLNHVGHSWRYATSGAVGRAGNAADRRLEHACG